jgi:hypothetical protein
MSAMKSPISIFFFGWVLYSPGWSPTGYVAKEDSNSWSPCLYWLSVRWQGYAITSGWNQEPSKRKKSLLELAFYSDSIERKQLLICLCLLYAGWIKQDSSLHATHVFIGIISTCTILASTELMWVPHMLLALSAGKTSRGDEVNFPSSYTQWEVEAFQT